MSHAVASNSEDFYFSPNFVSTFRKSYQIWRNWPKNKKLQAKAKLGDGKQPSPPPPPRAYGVKQHFLHR